MSFTTCLWVIAGGAIGTFLRYFVSVMSLPISKDLPWGTIFINISGCLLIGLFGTLTLAQGRFPVSENVRMFVMVGICGGFTTFSAFGLQTLDLMRAGAFNRAAFNAAFSVIACVGAVAVGHFVAAYFNNNAVQIAQLDIEEEA